MEPLVTLDSCELFRHLPAEEMEQLRQVAVERTFSPGQEIFKEGDPGDGAYFVTGGAVEISAILAGSERQVLTRVLPGDLFGEMTLIDQNPRSACATAQGETSVLFLPREPVVALVKRSPQLALTLIQEISQRLRHFNHRYVDKVLQAERMSLVGRFASSIVHDLKTPLTIIGMAALTACRESATQEARATAEERINKQIDRITNLVNDILEFTRGPQGTMAFCVVDWEEFVTCLLEDFRPDLEPKRVTLELDGSIPEVKPTINPKRISRVFYNLIDNAADAMPDGGSVKVRFRVEDNHIVSEVEDSGRGIPAEVLPHIFDAFATFGKPKGTGLGLSISQRIIEEHQGKISARNRDNGGAIFEFSLPLG